MAKPARSYTRRLVLPRTLVVVSMALGLVNISSVRALDFRLGHVQTLDDGVGVDHTCFQYDESTQVMFDMPRGWSTSSTAAAVTSSPLNRPTDQLQLEKSPLTPDTPFQGKGLEVYRQQFLAMVPKGAQNIRVVSEQDDPLPIFGWKEYGFTADYDFYGQSFRRGILFININPRVQLMMTAISAPDTFDAVHTAALRALRSWEVVPKSAGGSGN